MAILRAADQTAEERTEKIIKPKTRSTSARDYRGRLGVYRDYQSDVKAYEAEVAADTASYGQAEAARPIFSRGDTVEGDNVIGTSTEYAEALAAWTEKYGDTLGMGEERYEKEKDFLEKAEDVIVSERAYEEVSPFGVGRDVQTLISDTSNYEIVETYDDGSPKKIQEKSKVYTSGSGFRGVKVGNYIPYEATLTKEGKIQEEKTRSIGPSRSEWQGKWGTASEYSPYERAVLTYNDGIPSALKSKLTYKTSGDSSKGWSYSYYGIRPDTEINFQPTGELETKSIYDESQKSWRARGSYGGESSYKPFLDKFYDYGKGEVIDYPRPLSSQSMQGYMPDKGTADAIARATANKKSVVSKAPASKVSGFYNPYTGLGQVGKQYFQTAPQLNRMPNQMIREAEKTGYTTSVFENPFRPGTNIPVNVNPITNQKFRNQQDYFNFWNQRQARYTDIIEKQKTEKANIKTNILTKQVETKVRDILK